MAAAERGELDDTLVSCLCRRADAASSFGCGYVSVKDGKTVLEPERTKEYVAPQEKEKKGASPETTKRSAEPEPVAA